VLGHHGIGMFLPWSWWTYPLLQGFVGVHLFLVVSGFCIHARTARKEPDECPDFVPFWRRRLRRLYPPYLAAVGVTVFSLVVLSALRVHQAHRPVSGSSVWRTMAPGGAAEFGQASIVHLLMLFPFWPHARTVYQNQPFWSLALEEQLYLMYFMVPFLRRRIGMEKTLLVSLVVSILWRALAVFGPLGHGAPILPAACSAGRLGPEPAIRWLELGPSRWFEWVLGAAAAELAFGHLAPRRIYTSVTLALSAMGVALACQWCHAGWVFTDPFWGIAFFILVNRTVGVERAGRLVTRRWAKLLASIGVFSYSLYLVHEPLLHVLRAVLLKFAGGIPVQLAAMLLVIPLAWCFYRVFELPALDWSRRTAPAPNRQ
jgi:peptidoglycan/LPS O-acetylase OafA/YrhL